MNKNLKTTQSQDWKLFVVIVIAIIISGSSLQTLGARVAVDAACLHSISRRASPSHHAAASAGSKRSARPRSRLSIHMLDVPTPFSSLLFYCSSRGATRVPRSQWRQHVPLLHLKYARGSSNAKNKEPEQGRDGDRLCPRLLSFFPCVMDF